MILNKQILLSICLQNRFIIPTYKASSAYRQSFVLVINKRSNARNSMVNYIYLQGNLHTLMLLNILKKLQY